MSVRHKHYSELTPSGVDWLGDVPKHWDVSRLGKYFDERREKVSDKDFEPLSVTMQGIVPRLETAAKTDAGDNRKKVCVGDFVINSRSDRKGSSGVSPLNGSVSLISIVLTPRQIEGAFIHHLLKSQPFQEEFYRYGKGIVADLWSTNYSEMKNILLPVPSLEEQRAIALFLDRETGKIDRMIGKQERMIELLKEKRQAVISHAVTKGLNPNVPMKDSGIEWLGEIPEHWDVKRIKQISSIQYGIGEPPRYVDDGVPLVRATNIRSGRISEVNMVRVNPDDIPSARIVWLKEGDIIVVRSGAGTGDSSIIPKLHEGSIAGFDMMVRPTSVYPWFLGYALLSSYLRNGQIDLEKTRAAQPHLNAEELGDCAFLCPPFNEQKVIAEYVGNATAKIDHLIAKAEQAIELMKERRTALISAAVTGKIDVRDVTSNA
ncbi:restriction endonuclease subunit S [Pontiellaceae bacterium B12219]|nr:restriction endonuclease subunit S [Pontiellaceae bacterium B12219]